jgi:hypothetical protein
MRIAKKAGRGGASLAEAAIILVVFLVIICALIDLGMAVFRDNIISGAARNGARMATIHGKRSPPANGSWSGGWDPNTGYPGQNPYTVSADDPSDKIAAALRPYLIGLQPSDVTIKVDWGDGDNDTGSHVTVTVTAPYQAWMTFIFGNLTIPLQASSTMLIAH